MFMYEEKLRIANLHLVSVVLRQLDLNFALGSQCLAKSCFFNKKAKYLFLIRLQFSNHLSVIILDIEITKHFLKFNYNRT